VFSDSTLPAATKELVKIRASQINGCSFCTDMHTKDAAHAGETSTRLNLIAAWREAKVFTDAERAALELTEQGTRIADAAGGVMDEAWANAAKHYDEDQLAALVSLIALINAYNRVNVIVQQPAGLPARPVRITRSTWPGPPAPSRTSSSTRPGLAGTWGAVLVRPAVRLIQTSRPAVPRRKPRTHRGGTLEGFHGTSSLM
jgi:AhpD family alkylhydroperoxidase